VAKRPRVGDPAPDFVLDSTEGEIAFSRRLGIGAALLVFYPRDGAPACTRQLCDYRDNVEVFDDLGVQLLAINPQTIDSHRSFATEHRLPFPLLSDPGGKVCRQYGALDFAGTTRRCLVLVGRDGRVKWRRGGFRLLRRTARDVCKALAGLPL